jgi:hypothetical protein
MEPGEGNRALVLSISEGGLALRADRPLTEVPTLRMRFLLPESKSWVQTNGRIAWVSESKKEAGIRFINLPEDARNTIQKWVLLESLQEQSGKLSEGWLGYTANLPAEESAYNMLFEEILKSDFDAVHIPGLKTESFAWNYLRYSPLIRKLFWYQIPRQPSPRLLIRLDGTFESYKKTLSAKTRKNRPFLRHQRR